MAGQLTLDPNSARALVTDWNSNETHTHSLMKAAKLMMPMHDQQRMLWKRKCLEKDCENHTFTINVRKSKQFANQRKNSK